MKRSSVTAWISTAGNPEAVVARYAQRGILVRVRGAGSVSDVTERVLDSLSDVEGAA